MSDQAPNPTAKHGLCSLGGGIALAIAFFLPAVEGCGVELSMADLAKEEAAHFYIYAVAAGIALLTGFALVAQGTKARWMLLAQGITGGLAMLHLAWHVLQELGDEVQAEPLWGFWVLVLGVLGVSGQPWWSYAALGGTEGQANKLFDDAEEQTDRDTEGTGRGIPLSPGRIALAVIIAATLAAGWSWGFGKIFAWIQRSAGNEGLSTYLPWVTTLGTMLAAMSGRLLSGGRAIGLALLAGLTVAAVGTGLRYTALDGTTVLLIIDATLYGLLAGCVGGLARGNARAALAAAITGAVFALCLHFVPRDLYISLGEAIGAPASSALRRAIWWTAVLAAEAWALRKDHA